MKRNAPKQEFDESLKNDLKRVVIKQESERIIKGPAHLQSNFVGTFNRPSPSIPGQLKESGRMSVDLQSDDKNVMNIPKDQPPGSVADLSGIDENNEKSQKFDSNSFNEDKNDVVISPIIRS